MTTSQKRDLIVFVSLFALVMTFSILGYQYYAHVRAEQITTTTYPSRTHELQIVIKEDGGRFDCNLSIFLEQGSLRKLVFTTPDEGTSTGSEQGLWSQDSDFFLYVGKRFYIKNKAIAPSGLQLYFLYQVSTGMMWCNSSQTTLPTFSFDDVANKFQDYKILNESVK